MSARSPSPLYRRWLGVARARADRVAIRCGDTPLTFAELAAQGEALPAAGGPVISDATGAAFVLATLRAWRDAAPFVPLEPGAPFDTAALAALPPGVAHVKQTSGSTGDPRLVLFDAAQIAADADQVVSTMALCDHRGGNVGAISLAHSYGFSNLVTPLLLHGVPLTLADSPLPAAVATALGEAGADTVLAAVPAMWRAWSDADILRGARIGLAISAGAPLGRELERAVFERSGLKIHNFLGSSECGGIAYDHSAAPRERPNLVGTPLDGVTAELSPAGTLRVRSAAVGLRYWPAPDPSLPGDGTFTTGDLAALDPDGGIVLIGRDGQDIQVAGRRVAPGTIEEILAAAPGVRCCLVFGVPSSDPLRVEEVVAAINGTAGEAELRRALSAAGLPPWMRPRHWWFTEALKPDPRGKLSRPRWRERYLEAAGARSKRLD